MEVGHFFVASKLLSEQDRRIIRPAVGKIILQCPGHTQTHLLKTLRKSVNLPHERRAKHTDLVFHIGHAYFVLLRRSLRQIRLNLFNFVQGILADLQVRLDYALAVVHLSVERACQEVQICFRDAWPVWQLHDFS